MTTLFVILIFLASAILSIVVLIQNPKGGGLAGNIAGFSNQFMGVKQTTDVLEKGTWLFAGIIAVLCISAALFIAKPGSSGGGNIDRLPAPSSSQQAPAGTPLPNQQAPQPNR